MCFIDIIRIDYIKSYNIQIFPTQLYHVEFQLVKKFLSLDVTAVFLVYMEKMVCSNIVISTRNLSGRNTDSNHEDIGNKYVDWSVIDKNSEE